MEGYEEECSNYNMRGSGLHYNTAESRQRENVRRGTRRLRASLVYLGAYTALSFLGGEPGPEEQGPQNRTPWPTRNGLAEDEGLLGLPKRSRRRRRSGRRRRSRNHHAWASQSEGILGCGPGHTNGSSDKGFVSMGPD